MNLSCAFKVLPDFDGDDLMCGCLRLAFLFVLVYLNFKVLGEILHQLDHIRNNYANPSVMFAAVPVCMQWSICNQARW